jgi:hypothetical protein
LTSEKNIRARGAGSEEGVYEDRYSYGHQRDRLGLLNFLASSRAAGLPEHQRERHRRADAINMSFEGAHGGRGYSSAPDRGKEIFFAREAQPCGM